MRAPCGGWVGVWGVYVSISNVFYVVFSCGVWLLARAFLCAPESGAKSCPIARAPLGGSKTTLGWWGWGVWGSQRGPRCVPSYDLASRLVCSIRAECRRRVLLLELILRKREPAISVWSTTRAVGKLAHCVTGLRARVLSFLTGDMCKCLHPKRGPRVTPMVGPVSW